MLSIYKKYFSIKVSHTYYKELTSKEDVMFIPSRECRELMETNRMLFRKNVDGGISVLYRAAGESSSTPFISFNPGKYVFAIGAKEKAKFLNMTNLDSGSKAYAAGKLLYFRNSGTTTALIYDLLDSLRPALFTYEFSFTVPDPESTESGELVIRNENSVQVFSQAAISRDPSGTYKVPLDLRDLPKGKYTFEYKDGTNSVKQETTYLDTDLAGKDILGVVEISGLDAAAPSYTAPVFNASFVRQETLWRYNVVLKSGKVLSSDTLEIVDLAYDDTNSSYSEYTFSYEGEVTLTNGLKAFRFLSDQLIPFFEEPKMDLKLRKTTSGVTTLINSLPNPLSSGTIAELIETGNIGVSEVYVYV